MFLKMIGKRFFQDTRKAYKRILFSVITAIIIAMIAFSAILYSNFEKIALSLIYNFQKDSLNQVSYSATLMSETAKTLATQIYFEQAVSPLFYQDPDGNEINTALKLLNMYKLTTPLIDSIYIYNGASDIFYTNSISMHIYDKESFYDKDIIQILNNYKKYALMKPIARQIKIDVSSKYSTANNVYTYIFYDYSSNSNHLDKAVIINISVDWMGNIISKMNLNDAKGIYIIDGYGKVVLDIGKNSLLTNLSGKSYIQRILASGKPTGYFTDTVDGEKSLVIYAGLQNLSWKFIRIVPESKIFIEIDNIRYKVIRISSIVLILITLLLLFTSRITYKPVNTILNDLAALNLEKNANRDILKQRALQGIILGEISISNQDFESMREKYNINLDFTGNLALILLRIDNYKEFSTKYTINDRILLKYGITHIASKVLSICRKSEVVDIHDDKIVILMNIYPDSSSESRGSMMHSIKKIQDMIRESLGLTVSATVNLKNGNTLEIPSIFNKVSKASVYRLFLGHNCIIDSDSVEKLQNMEYECPKSVEKEFVNALMSHNIEKAVTIFNGIILEVSLNSYSSFYITIMKLAIVLNNTINSILESFEISLNYDINSFIDELNQKETIQEINTCFEKVFAELKTTLETKHNKKHETIVNEIIQMIQNRYEDANLSIYSLAKAVDMSPGYLGKIFLKSTSISISDYISNVRINKSKELLYSTSLSVNEIAEKVGFSNQNYFYPLFKKMTGITPNEYRHSNIHR